MKSYFLASLMFFSSLACADFSGRVVGVADGDTISVLTKANQLHKVRLIYIDAPESGQAYGAKSKQNLSNLIFNKNVMVKSNTKDQYGRDLGEVYLGDTNINAVQVHHGMAWAYRYYIQRSGKPETYKYIDIEKVARSKRAGLWRDRNPIEPYQFRRNHRSNQTNNGWQ